jgi:integrase
MDPLTDREIRLRKTCKTERAAQIELGKLLAMAQAGRQPDSDVTVAQLLDQYVSTAGRDVSTRASNLGYIRRTIKPADEPGTRPQITRPRRGHDCGLSRWRPHVCKPMAKSANHGIHSVLSGAFEAAMRWEWTDRNPAASAKPPTPRRQTILAYLAGRRGQGDSRGPRAQRCPGAVPVARGGHRYPRL